jgi:hypothetical protein
MPNANAFADRYVALWNELDPDCRRERLMSLYEPDALYVFYRRDPLRGWAAILGQLAYTQRIYQPLGYTFRSTHGAYGGRHLVVLGWAMVSTADGELEMSGQDVIVLSGAGRIRADYQFHEQLPSSFRYNDGFEEHGVATRAARPTLVRRPG